MTAIDLLAELKRLNIKVSVNGDKLLLNAPVGVITPELKEAVLKHKPELIAILSRQPVEEVFWPGIKAKVYPARPSCLEAGGCLHLRDCDLFPLTWRWGWCRERTPLVAIDGRKEAKANAG